MADRASTSAAQVWIHSTFNVFSVSSIICRKRQCMSAAESAPHNIYLHCLTWTLLIFSRASTYFVINQRNRAEKEYFHKLTGMSTNSILISYCAQCFFMWHNNLNIREFLACKIVGVFWPIPQKSFQRVRLNSILCLFGYSGRACYSQIKG